MQQRRALFTTFFISTYFQLIFWYKLFTRYYFLVIHSVIIHIPHIKVYFIKNINFCIRTYAHKIRILNINPLFSRLSYFTLMTNIKQVGFKLNCWTPSIVNLINLGNKSITCLHVIDPTPMYRSAESQTPSNAADLFWSCEGLWRCLSFVFSRPDCHLTI